VSIQSAAIVFVADLLAGASMLGETAVRAAFGDFVQHRMSHANRTETFRCVEHGTSLST